MNDDITRGGGGVHWLGPKDRRARLHQPAPWRPHPIVWVFLVSALIDGLFVWALAALFAHRL